MYIDNALFDKNESLYFCSKNELVHHIPRLHYTNSPLVINTLTLQLLFNRNDRVLVTIWEDYLPQIDIKKMQQESKTQHIILAFSSLLLTNFSGNNFYTFYKLIHIIHFLIRIASYQQI